jgi:DNA-binding NarL/FixJ family response regulator
MSRRNDAAPASPPPVRVVIVARSRLMREKIAQRVHEVLRYQVAAECATAAAAKEAILRERPELAIVDWGLPDDTGFEIVIATAARRPRTRWFFLCGHEHDGIIAEAVNVGVHGFMLHSEGFSTFDRLVRGVMAGAHHNYCQRSTELLFERWRKKPIELKPKLLQVLRLYTRGRTTKEIAAQLNEPVRNVQNRLTEIKRTLNIFHPCLLCLYAIQRRLIWPF